MQDCRSRILDDFAQCHLFLKFAVSTFSPFVHLQGNAEFPLFLFLNIDYFAIDISYNRYMPLHRMCKTVDVQVSFYVWIIRVHNTCWIKTNMAGRNRMHGYVCDLRLEPRVMVCISAEPDTQQCQIAILRRINLNHHPQYVKYAYSPPLLDRKIFSEDPIYFL